MLQNFSDRIRNSRWLGYGIVAAITIPFVILGIEAYLRGGGGRVAAEVNGTTIPTMTLERQVSSRQAQLRQQFGGKLPEIFSDAVLREQVLGQLIMKEVLRQTAADARLHIGAAQLAALIRQQGVFLRDGQFDPELYRQALRQVGLTPKQYEARLRQALLVTQLRNGITATAFALPQEARQAAQFQRQERQVGVLEYPRARAAEKIEVTADDINAYYQQHRDSFQTRPRVRVAYLDLSLEALADKVEVTEDELRAEYQAQQQRSAQSSERRAAHLLIAVPDNATEAQVEIAREEAKRLRERLVHGDAKFAALAREHSDDDGSAAQGGDLGYIERGTMMPPFEQALFALKEPGDISQPVRTSYGFHLIKLLDIRTGETAERSFAEKRDQIEQRLRREKAERLFRDRVQVLRNSAYEQPGSLDPAAAATGLEIQESVWFAQGEDEGGEGDGEGIARFEAVRQAAFQPDVRQQGLNSKLLELGGHRVAVVRVIGQQPAKLKPLEQVREQVRERVRQQRIGQVFTDWTASIAARLEQGTAPADLAGDAASYRDLGWIRRDDTSNAAIAKAAFEVPPPAGDAAAHRAVGLPSGSRAVVVVREARLPEVDDPAVEQARTRIQQGMARAELTAWSAGLRAGADVKRPN